ncbi:DUF2750 domain-containing protein [Shewanella sp. WXL01]|uniref:DUF2750 domain-containing protein n=1 Tax=Shewanella maritima TaxID=2520507 RepID=A0A411PLT0_9GAMM|nr:MULTISPECIES: DUF2750 domain-containing protein [Shewanella]NKF51606.1 DUF2750 domain-containing protein [Shewanella sp. WXL01]QBF84474.1 DUF2750 domain-containing protein [Shewanella maritima]
MTEQSATLTGFIAQVKEHQVIWALQDETNDGFVVCDSSEYEDTDVMPLWSSKDAAQSHCTEEWADYSAVEIKLGEFLEYWVGDLNDDGVLVGIDWQVDQDCEELDPIVLAKSLVDVEEE